MDRGLNRTQRWRWLSFLTILILVQQLPRAFDAGGWWIVVGIIGILWGGWLTAQLCILVDAGVAAIEREHVTKHDGAKLPEWWP